MIYKITANHNFKPILLAACIFLFFVVNTEAQTRYFISLGGSTSFGGNTSTFFAKVPVSWSADLEVDKKVFGSLYVVSGLSSYGIGYTASKDIFTPSSSEYSARYICIPLMARWNVGNRNFLYIDFGLNTMYLAHAHLHESQNKFGSTRDYDGNIAPYMNRFYQSIKFQETFAFNRFSISLFIVAQFKGQQAINNLADHWGLNAQQSTFLNSNGYSDFFIGGFKLGCRIR
jgi:hypothetical protein